MKEAADILDLTDRAVRLACQDGRLKASQENRQWRIAQEDFIHYQNARNAA